LTKILHVFAWFNELRTLRKNVLFLEADQW